MQSVLVILACLSGDCRAHVLTAPMPYAACVSASMPAAAKWVGEHPKWRVTRIVCADPRKLSSFLGRTQA
jgi:hypothetical protein